MDHKIKECEVLDWNQRAQDRAQLWALVKTVMKLQVS